MVGFAAKHYAMDGGRHDRHGMPAVSLADRCDFGSYVSFMVIRMAPRRADAIAENPTDSDCLSIGFVVDSTFGRGTFSPGNTHT